MKRKSQNITSNIWPALAIFGLLGVWQLATGTGMIEEYLLPSPVSVARAFIADFPLLMENAKVTLAEAFIGLACGVLIGFVIAVIMDRFDKLYQAFYPIIVLTQTIPTVAIAPLLVLWFGYEMLPKVILIVLTTFFPITVSLLDGFRAADKDMINLMKSMGASKMQIFRHVKFPGALSQFFASLRISASYAVVGAVISEWLGGFSGLGVYMTRVKKAFAFDKMFAVIFLISMVSLLLMEAVDYLQKKCMPWEEQKYMKKRITSIVLVAAMALGFVACVGEKETEKELTKVTFVLDWTPNTNHTGLYVAQEKGYFEEAGLEVEIVQPPEGGAELLVAAGEAQFGVSCQDSMMPALVGENALPIEAVATILQHNTSGIISRAGEGMDVPKGLEGKKYATWDLDLEKATIKNVMEADGGDFSKVELIPSTVTDEVSALKSKSVDAIWIFYGWAGIAAEVAGLETDYFAFADINEELDFYTPVIIGNKDWMAENEEITKAFLSATAKGYEYAIENGEEAADILLEAAPELDEALVKASQEYLNKEYKAEVDQWGYIDPARWNAFYNWVNANGLAPEEIPENTGFNNSYLE